MAPSFNPSEVGMVPLGKNRYQINANDLLEDRIVIWGHLPFEWDPSTEKYTNEEGVQVYVK
jgi:hypothetical protein